MTISRTAIRKHARSTLLAMTVITAGLGTAVALPAHAVSDDTTRESPTPQHMAQMHELMTAQNPGMARMHELMMGENPGMARMHEQMMTHETEHGGQE